MIRIDEISFLPSSPGCYLFKDENGTVLYVGKAKDLKKRVSSYFQKRHDLDPKTEMLVSKIKNIDFVMTENEAEAFLLENNLIKKFTPHFNLDLKDSRRYAYLRLSDNEIPWLEVARSRNEKGEYFGPFVSGSIRKLVMDTVSKNFKILTRKPSPQLKKIINREDYAKRVKQAKKILKGKAEELISELEAEMKQASKSTNFEYAITLRNQIEALKTLKERQRIDFSRKIDAHIINYAISAEKVHLLLFNVRKGIVEEKQEFVFPMTEEFLEEFLAQFYGSGAKIPEEIMLPKEVSESLKEFLSKKAGFKVKVIVPVQGEKKELLEFVSKNITATFFAGKERTTALQAGLGLEKLPRVIECFDISHLSGTNTVASMVTFNDGFADKKNYRKFRMQTLPNSDDLAAMREVIKRRYSRVIAEKLKKPDLIVVDGGPTQLSAALGELEKLKLNIPVISLAKQFEEIYSPGKSGPLRLERKNKGLQLLQAIRDEAHRFAITYQRLLRKKEIGVSKK